MPNLAAESRALLLCTSAVLIVAASSPSAPQDWIPFHVAPGMAQAGLWRELYPGRTATSLFDVSQKYHDLAHAEIADSGRPAFLEGSLTAFISPPPAAFLMTPVRALTWQLSARLWRVALASSLTLAFFFFGEHLGRRASRLQWRWSVMCALSSLLWFYVVVSGQPSAWLVVAAIASLSPPLLIVDVLGGVALALAVLTKATPAAVALGLWVVGRRRLALVAIGISGASVVAASPHAGVDAWRSFLDISVRLGSTVITDWNNASVDGMLVRSTRHIADPMFQEPSVFSLAVSWIVRVGLLLFAGWRALQSSTSSTRRVGAVWVAWLAATPLLWVHYLGVLLPVLACTFPRKRDPVLVWAGFFLIFLLARFTGWIHGLAGNVLCLTWLAAAFWLLSSRAWPSDVEVV